LGKDRFPSPSFLLMIESLLLSDLFSLLLLCPPDYTLSLIDSPRPFVWLVGLCHLATCPLPSSFCLVFFYIRGNFRSFAEYDLSCLRSLPFPFLSFSVFIQFDRLGQSYYVFFLLAPFPPPALGGIQPRHESTPPLTNQLLFC